MDTAALERAERWVGRIVRVVDTVAEGLETVSSKGVELLNAFSEGMEDEIMKIRDAHDDEVAACKANHPAGKGVFDEVVDEDDADLTREEKIEAIQDYLRNAGVTSGSWFTHPETVTDNTVNWGYDYINNKAKAWDTYN